MEREGGWLDPAHHVGHQQQESPRLPHPQPLIRIRRVVLRGRTPQTITQPVIIENLHTKDRFTHKISHNKCHTKSQDDN